MDAVWTRLLRGALYCGLLLRIVGLTVYRFRMAQGTNQQQITTRGRIGENQPLKVEITGSNPVRATNFSPQTMAHRDRSGLIQSRQMRREHYASAYIVHASVIPLLTHRRKIGEETDDLQGSFERTPDFPDNEGVS